MTGSEIIEFYHNLVDQDSLDSSFEYSLLNSCKGKLEAEREWEFLKKLDSSNSASSSPIALPTDCEVPLLIYVGDDRVPFYPIPYEQKPLFQNSGRYFIIDQGAKTFQFLDPSVSGTVYLYYLKSTPDITASTSPVFPNKFHMILAYDISQQFYISDQSERQFTWGPELDMERRTLYNLMCDWDERIKVRARENGFNRMDLSQGLSTDKYGFDISSL
jgi:hypothetical protein